MKTLLRPKKSILSQQIKQQNKKRLHYAALLSIMILILSGCTEAPPIQNSAMLDIQSKQAEQEKTTQDDILLSMAFLKENNTVAAKQWLINAQRVTPKKQTTALSLAKAAYDHHTQQLHHEAAILQHALQRHPNNQNLLLMRAKLYCQQYDFNQAQQLFTKLKHSPKNTQMSQVDQTAGLCALNNRRDKQALVYFQEAMQQNPDDHQADVFAAKIATKLKEYQLSLDFLSKINMQDQAKDQPHQNRSVEKLKILDLKKLHRFSAAAADALTL